MVTMSPLCSSVPPACSVSRSRSIDHGGGADHARPAHAARHHRRVAGHAAPRGEDADRGMHALHVLGRGLDAGEDYGVALRLEMHRLVGVEHELAGGGAGRGGQALGQHRLLGLGIERRMQQLVELVGIDARHRLLAGDEALLGHVDGDLQRGLRRALARAGLQHEQLAVLHGELDVLDVAEMRFELGAGRLRARRTRRA